MNYLRKGLVAFLTVLTLVFIVPNDASEVKAAEGNYQLGQTVTGSLDINDEEVYSFSLDYDTKVKFAGNATSPMTIVMITGTTELTIDMIINGENGVNKTMALPKGFYVISVWSGENPLEYSLTMSDVTEYTKKISFPTKQDIMSVGEKKTVTYRKTPKDSSIIKGIKWKSGNTKVASVSNKGVVKAKSLGKTEISAQLSGGNTAKCTLVVDSMTCKIAVGGKKNVKINGVKGVKWSSSNTRIATVKYGKIKGKSRGKAIITAKKGSTVYTCKVIVTDLKK